MRFDDRIGTVLAQREESPSARRLKLRQLLDLLAQGFDNFSPEQRAEALAYLRQIDGSLTPEERERVQSLARLCPDGEADPVPKPQAEKPRREPEPPASGFTFETDASGTITVVEGAPREALFGLSLSAAPDPDGWGVSDQAAQAFRKRRGFRNAYLKVPGNGAASGNWCISAVPFFDPKRDTFLGYCGTARRPVGDELAAFAAQSNPGALFGSSMPADSMRQLVHEIRTPLNAIAGFAEMIDNQMLGPAADEYRQRARAIRGEVERLLAAVEDLDTAAEVDTKAPAVGGQGVDLADLVHRIAATDPRLCLAASPALPPVLLDKGAADKIIGKMLALAAGLAGPDGSVRLALSPEADSQRLTVERPLILQGCSEAELLDPGFTPSGDCPDAPALGVGFTLRFIRNLLRASGGMLIVEPEHFHLSFPAALKA